MHPGWFSQSAWVVQSLAKHAMYVGSSVGEFVGDFVGDLVGAGVGSDVGTWVKGDVVGGNDSGLSSCIPTSMTMPIARIPRVVVSQQTAFRDPIA